MTKLEKKRLSQSRANLRYILTIISLLFISSVLIRFNELAGLWLLLFTLVLILMPVVGEMLQRRDVERTKKKLNAVKTKVKFLRDIRAGLISVEDEDEEEVADMSPEKFKHYVRSLFIRAGFSCEFANMEARAVYREEYEEAERLKNTAHNDREVRTVEIEPGVFAVGHYDRETGQFHFSDKLFKQSAGDAETARAVVSTALPGETVAFNVDRADIAAKKAAINLRNEKHKDFMKNYKEYKTETTQTC